MKKALFLLLLVTSVSYGQALFDKGIKIPNNTTSTTATKVNVQESNGLVNTIAKSDLIEVLEYASAINLPLTGVAGKIYVVLDSNILYRWNGTIYKELTADISGKVDKVTGKSLIADNEITRLSTVINYDNSSNITALSNKVDKVAGKSLISDTEITRLAGVSNVDISGKANIASPTFTGVPLAPTATAGTSTTQIATTAFVSTLDANNVKLTGAQTITGAKTFTLGLKLGNGTVASPSISFYDEISSDTGFNHTTDGIIDFVSNGSVKSSLTPASFNINIPINLDGTTTLGNELILNANGNTNMFFQQSGVTKYIAGYIPSISAFRFSNGSTDVLVLNDSGIVKINNLSGTGSATVMTDASGNLTRSVGYKVYSALLNDASGNTITATVLENTLGSPISWTLDGIGIVGTLTNAFTLNKTTVHVTNGHATTDDFRGSNSTVSIIRINTNAPPPYAPDSIDQMSVEIRVYN